ncbi:MAG: FAD-dependent oxidoreductase [Candidatus Aenigmarchaeota archaeon]|nr:FAD-dependent oxidoreductase [Candidatus Aenigmarchaeota archaeon]
MIFMDYDVIVIGGGITGLAAAHECSKKGLKTAIIEKGPSLGGLLYSVKSGKSFIEAFYHHFFTIDSYLMEKMKELGLKKKIVWQYTKTAFLFDNGIYELSAPQHILFFKPLNMIEKMQFVKLMIIVKLSKDYEKLDGISAKEWIIKNSSRSLYKKMFEPLLKSKFGDKAEQASAAWFVERINMRGERSIKGEKLGYIKGGFKVLLDELEKRVIKNKVDVFLNSSVDAITMSNNFYSVKMGEKTITSKSIISTIPPKFLINYGLFDEKFSKRLEKIEYQGSLCILVSMKRKLTDYYWVNIVKESEIGALIEHTNFQPLKYYDGYLLYVARYPSNNSPIWQMSEDQIWEKYFSELQKLFQDIKKSDIKWYKVFKGFNAGVIYKKGFKKNFLNYETPLKGFFIGGLFNMYPERSVNLSIKIGTEMAELASKYVKS